MIAEDTFAPGSLSLGAISSGESDTAVYVQEQFRSGLSILEQSRVPGIGRSGVLAELKAMGAETARANWDGHGALAVTAEAVALAEKVIRCLPLGVSGPTIGAEPDGQITLEWYFTPRHTLSVSVSPDADLHYAALLGLSRRYGTEPFLGVLPGPILQLIRTIDSLQTRGAA